MVVHVFTWKRNPLEIAVAAFLFYMPDALPDAKWTVLKAVGVFLVQWNNKHFTQVRTSSHAINELAHTDLLLLKTSKTPESDSSTVSSEYFSTLSNTTTHHSQLNSNTLTASLYDNNLITFKIISTIIAISAIINNILKVTV